MDDYYSKIDVDDSMDNEDLFKKHVIREDEDLFEIDKMLKNMFAAIE